jgi:drug/metabolite transporter superfamily protein YnfA
MPLNVKSISVSVAVICFFVIAIVGWFSDVSPFTCCKRALAAAVVVYIAASLAVKAINVILIDAIVEKQMNQQKGNANGSGN